MEPLALIADPTRQRIVRLVWEGERSAGEIASHFDVTFGAVSQHLAKLHGAGLVSVRKEGRRRWYSARREAFGPLASALEAMWFGKLGELKRLAEAEQRREDAAAGAGRSARRVRHATGAGASRSRKKTKKRGES